MLQSTTGHIAPQACPLSNLQEDQFYINKSSFFKFICTVHKMSYYFRNFTKVFNLFCFWIFRLQRLWCYKGICRWCDWHTFVSGKDLAYSLAIWKYGGARGCISMISFGVIKHRSSMILGLVSTSRRSSSWHLRLTATCMNGGIMILQVSWQRWNTFLLRNNPRYSISGRVPNPSLGRRCPRITSLLLTKDDSFDTGTLEVSAIGPPWVLLGICPDCCGRWRICPKARQRRDFRRSQTRCIHCGHQFSHS